jgi:arsenate reductase (thioredoxin)
MLLSMAERPLNVLFLCTANSARSILAEACLNSVGGERFRAYSAGSHPSGTVNPYALKLLERKGISTDGLSSKAWDEFAAPGAPPMHVIITVCDNAAGETCPVWPGRPASAHWGVADPAAAVGDDDVKRAAFERAYATLKKRIDALASLDPASLDRAALERRLRAIGDET